MNDVKRQLLLLVSLMIFLSSITIFLVDTTAEVDYNVSENSSSNESISVNFEKREGEGLYAQAVNGWIMLANDILTGFNAVDSNLEDQSDP